MWLRIVLLVLLVLLVLEGKHQDVVDTWAQYWSSRFLDKAFDLNRFWCSEYECEYRNAEYDKAELSTIKTQEEPKNSS